MSKLTTISGYVPTRPYNELDSDRYEFLTLDQAEPNPGLPDSDYSLFTSMKSGERRFTTDPRLSGLSFKGDTLEQIPSSNPTYFLVLKNLPGSGLVNGLDDSVAWSLGEIEEQDTLQTVTDRGNVTTQGITVNTLTTVANADIGTNLIVGGNLTVNGTTTTLNTSELTVDDINIQIADGAPDAATADGAGITVDGALATMTYVAATDRWSFNKDLDIENLYNAGDINLDGAGNQSIVNTNGVLNVTSTNGVDLEASLTNILDGAGNLVFASFSSGAINLNEILTVTDSANLQGEIRATNVPPQAGVVKTLFRRQSDGLIMEGEVEEVEVDKILLGPTNVDSDLFIVFSEANGGQQGFDSAEFDLDLTYNPGTNTLTLQNITATGLADLDSTNVAGDLQLSTVNSNGTPSTGRLLDSAGRSFVIYDSSGNLLWGNNGTSAGNLGGPQAVNLNLEDLADVNITNIQNGQVIKWDAVAAEWINANDLEGSGGSGIALTDLSVTQNAPSGTGALSYNNLNGVFTYTPPALPDITNISLDDLVNVDAVGDVSNNTYVLKSDGDGSFSLAAQTGGGGGNAFTTIASSGQSNITAASATDTLNIEGSASIGVTTTPGTNTVTISYTGSATGLASRGTINNTTGTIANDGSADLTISNGFETYALLKIETSHAAWVRLYVDTASRTADASRVITDDPAPDAGVIAEIISTGSETIKMSPGVIGWLESGTDIPVRVTNKSGGNAAVQVTLTLVQLEA